jgi:uncharacterized protein (TIGR00730 family)
MDENERKPEPNGAERAALVEVLKDSPAYRVAYEDSAFLHEDFLRPVRLQLELHKPEMLLQQYNIRSTVVVFGSARIQAPDHARADLAAAQEKLVHDPGHTAEVARCERRVALSRYYDEARVFARTVSLAFRDADRRDYVVVTGGGPGIMEAANRGAHDVGAMSAAFNITLPTEQTPNPYISPDLCFQFHYFAIRKMHFLLRAVALVAFPGGFGTLDELFEALMLVQTGKVRPMPIVLVGREFWTELIDFELLVDSGMISPGDRDLFVVVDTAAEAVQFIYDFHGREAPIPAVALSGPKPPLYNETRPQDRRR